MAEFDSPWKEILEFYFLNFLELCSPELFRAIDPSIAPIARDKELQKIAVDSEIGTKVVDKLFEVQLIDGQLAWIFVHVEVQNQWVKDFAKRMYVYHYRIQDRYNRPVVSIAILGDENPNWRPCHHTELVFGCDLDFRFPVIKITDYGERLDELEKSENPFAAVIVAHLMTLQTANRPLDRYQWKLRILRAMYRRGIEPNQLRQLFRVIDWLMQLPPAIERQFWQELEQIESEINMPYVTSVERIGHEKGREEGLEEGIEKGLEKGLWVGKIQMAQRWLRIEQTPSDVLLATPLAELQKIFTQLEVQLDLPETQS